MELQSCMDESSFQLSKENHDSGAIQGSRTRSGRFYRGTDFWPSAGKGFKQDWLNKNSQDVNDGPESSDGSGENPLTEQVDETPIFTLKLPYVRKSGDELVKTLKRKIHQNVSGKIRLRVLFTTNKIARFCSVKDQLSDPEENGIVYHIKCPDVYVDLPDLGTDTAGSRRRNNETHPDFSETLKTNS